MSAAAACTCSRTLALRPERLQASFAALLTVLQVDEPQVQDMLRRRLSLLSLHPDTIEGKFHTLADQVTLFLQQLRAHSTESEGLTVETMLLRTEADVEQDGSDGIAQQLQEGGRGATCT